MPSIIFSTKADGDLLFSSHHPELNQDIKARRLKFFEKNQIDPSRVVNLSGSHGTRIATVTEADLGKGSLDPDTRIPDTDGLITDFPHSYLMITGADCFPVLFSSDDDGFDSAHHKAVIGAAHCGWRGIIGLKADFKDFPERVGHEAGIVPQMIKAFQERFAIGPNRIHVWIGPGIKACHYDVEEARAILFTNSYPGSVIKNDHKFFLDLPQVLRAQLQESGVAQTHITEHSDCTYCEAQDWFSWRRDKPAYVEANAFLINRK